MNSCVGENNGKQNRSGYGYLIVLVIYILLAIIISSNYYVL